MDALRRLVHQLRGACGGYGFDPITPFATAAELAIDADEGIKSVTENINSLIEIIRTIDGFDHTKERQLVART
jgi:chemotaxis protein histidine kinase CheA